MILVCGEALVDLFILGTRAERLAAEVVAGGSPFNVAVGLARLQRRAAFCGGLSTDPFGAFLRDRLTAEGVDLRYAVLSPRLSTIVVVATDANGQPNYTFHGEKKADREIAESDLKAALEDDVSALVFGSYTLVVPPVSETYLALARREQARRVISVDPNLRPTVIGDMRSWEERFDAFLATADIVKASQEDLEIVYGKTVNAAEIAAAWRAKGPSLIVVTQGSGGAIACTDADVIEVPGHTVNVIDTVGAGDTFHAALLAELDRTGDLTKQAVAALTPARIASALSFATAASAITCTRRGADLPTTDDVAAFMGAATAPEK